MRCPDFTIDDGRQGERVAGSAPSQGPESAQSVRAPSRREAAQIAEPRVRHDTDNFLMDRRRLASALMVRPMGEAAPK